jgi:Ca2+-binding EF-hand superfamily protein
MAANYESQASTNYKEAFSLFDKRGNGRVTLDSLGDLLRACGQNPTLAEIRDLEKNVGGECELIAPFVYMRRIIPSRLAMDGAARTNRG